MNGNRHISIWMVITVISAWFGCTKDVDIDFPDTEPVVVVDGSIELGSPPIIFLTRSRSFNEPLGSDALTDIFVNDAIVEVSNGTDTVQLGEICAAQLSMEDLEIAAELLGTDVGTLQSIDYCIYVDTSFSILGELNTTYQLDILTTEGDQLHAETFIREPIPLDSLWFEFWAGSDSLGFIYAELTDPGGEQNAYQWSAQRTNLYPGTEEMKDNGFIEPLGSVFEDRFFDGLNFEFFYNRGQVPNSAKEDDNNEESGFFKLGDTVDVRFATTTIAAYQYYTTSDDQLVNNGSPFAVPANLPSNIEGGIGLWAGYAPVVQEVICIP
jgi:hypothetical protein